MDRQKNIMAGSIKEDIDKRTRIAFEAAVLEVKDCMNPRMGRITLSETASKLLLVMYKIDVWRIIYFICFYYSFAYHPQIKFLSVLIT